VLPEGPEFFRLEVQDNGIGISPEDIKFLFTEFRQLDSTMAKKYQGTGLGLALTRKIVESQGGRVGVSSSSTAVSSTSA
jgi:signal transduction histidine kinase